MKYFVTNDERKHYIYYELQKGEFDGKSYWKEDSIYLDDDIDFHYPEFFDAVSKVLPFDPFDDTRISLADWSKISEILKTCNGTGKEMFCEIDDWVQDSFDQYGCFTIIGL